MKDQSARFSNATRTSVVSLFDQIAPVYDRLNRIISWGKDRDWRRRLAQHLSPLPDQIILDISAGTGDMELALKEVCPSVQVIGLDPSLKMIELYRAKIPGSVITLGAAEFLPLGDGTISQVVCTFGLRNFQDRSAAFREIHRVLKPGGNWGFLEMSAPQGIIFPLIYGFYFKRIVPLIGAILSPLPGAYRYLRDTVYEFPGYQRMLSEHLRAGFDLIRYESILRGAVGLYVFRKRSLLSFHENSPSR